MERQSMTAGSRLARSAPFAAIVAALAALAGTVALAACGGGDGGDGGRVATTAASATGAAASMELRSDAFAEGGAIPAEYTCDGRGISPPVSWSKAPPNARALVLLMDDPDAPRGTFDRWVLYNLPPSTTRLAAGVPDPPGLDGAQHGRNGGGRNGYTGPCPPRSSEHRYHFRIYALDATLKLETGASKQDVERAMEGHVLASADLTGRYRRP